jgi:hypothetical protein
VLTVEVRDYHSGPPLSAASKASRLGVKSGPRVDAPLRFDCGCVTVGVDSSRVRYYLDTCGDNHYELVS